MLIFSIYSEGFFWHTRTGDVGIVSGVETVDEDIGGVETTDVGGSLKVSSIWVSKGGDGVSLLIIVSIILSWLETLELLTPPETYCWSSSCCFYCIIC